jgi:hypothetical protein
MSKDGFDNEKRIVQTINNKKFEKLNTNLQNFVKDLFPKVNDGDLIFASCDGGQNKSDLSIWIKGDSKDKQRISVKKGSGNSVHQEPIEDFIIFLNNSFKIDIQLKNDLRFFIWGDYTLDGKGDKSNRMSASELNKKFPDLIGRISKFMENHKVRLIERFVIKGPKSHASPDFIYYGDEDKGLWGSSKEVLKILSIRNSRSAIPIGSLTFQAWNRAISKDSTSDHKRGVIQLKWPSIKEDLKKLMKDE